jgi:hypothetical protein
LSVIERPTSIHPQKQLLTAAAYWANENVLELLLGSYAAAMVLPELGLWLGQLRRLLRRPGFLLTGLAGNLAIPVIILCFAHAWATP